ncbi:recombinase family protein [Roseibium sp. CAU 1637]|uniref:Recombinase family protein n=1 Tax=Roseibium limicola TaxID=2816037 RepID=A0A939EP93_9HYPH|nr:recombinase family protein [Roseibium limicola]MBO0345003.1 recombinase family protein [Roseibium limicola]
MKIGYARVSSRWYQAELQISALKSEGCDRIWKDTTRDGMLSTSGLEDFIGQLAPGTTVIATRLSAVARSLPDLLYFLESVTQKGAKFRSLAEPWCDTSVRSPSELLQILRGTVEFDVELKALDAATIEDSPSAVGITVGRPNKLSEGERIKAISLLRIGKSAAEVGRLLGVSRSTISRLKTSLRD